MNPEPIEYTFDDESAEYRAHRERLLQMEIELKEQRERVAEFRRQLPLGRKVTTDYVFREGPADVDDNDAGKFFDTRLSGLFAGGKETLLVDHLMYAPDAEEGCPMCSLWADGYNGVAHHLDDRVSFVVVARAPLEKLRDWARRRGWQRLRLLSSHDNTFNKDFGAECDAACQHPGMSVFKRTADGAIHHCYTSEASLQHFHHRGMDLFNPLWNLLDLTPEGRGEWMPSQFYEG